MSGLLFKYRKVLLGSALSTALVVLATMGIARMASALVTADPAPAPCKIPSWSWDSFSEQCCCCKKFDNGKIGWNCGDPGYPQTKAACEKKTPFVKENAS